MVQSGQADVINAVPVESVAQIQSLPAIEVIARPALRTFGFGLNLNRKAFQDVRVRHALNHAVDRAALIKAVFRGYATPIDSPLSPFTTGYGPVGTFDYNPDKAKRLLGEAGWNPGPDGTLRKDGEVFEVTVLTPQGMLPKDIEVTQALQGFLGKVGVKATINKVEPAAFWDYLRVPPDKMAWDLVLFGFNPSNGDGGYHLSSLFASNPSRTERPRVWNFTWYTNPKVDSLLAESDQMVDAAKRKALLVEAARLAWTDAPYVWLYAENVVVAKRKESARRRGPAGGLHDPPECPTVAPRGVCRSNPRPSRPAVRCVEEALRAAASPPQPLLGEVSEGPPRAKPVR